MARRLAFTSSTWNPDRPTTSRKWPSTPSSLIDSGATINITSDDFSKGTVVATGDPNATINLINNYWGTIDPTQIANKITDHTDNSNLPYVAYEPFLSENATATYASSASIIYNAEAQTVTLSATVIQRGRSPVNGGSVTFTVLNGTADVGTPIIENVVSGAASGAYTIPAGIPGGVYTIQAAFSGTGTLSGSTDSSQTLTVSDASTTTAASSATTTFSASDQSISLSATVTSSAGIVNEGTETFTIYSGMTQVGNPATADVSEALAVAAQLYAAWWCERESTYTIQAVYDGTVDYGASTDTSQSLTVNARPGDDRRPLPLPSVAYSSDSQYVTLSAMVSSVAGTVDEGAITFTIESGGTDVGTPISGTVSDGSATVSYQLPGGTPVRHLHHSG